MSVINIYMNYIKITLIYQKTLGRTDHISDTVADREFSADYYVFTVRMKYSIQHNTQAVFKEIMGGSAGILSRQLSPRCYKSEYNSLSLYVKAYRLRKQQRHECQYTFRPSLNPSQPRNPRSSLNTAMPCRTYRPMSQQLVSTAQAYAGFGSKK